MRTNQREAPAHAKRAKHSLVFRLSALALLGSSLAGCDLGIPDGGYAKVVNREREPIGQHSRPNPPPVVAGIGGSGGGELPTLAANAPSGVTQAMVEEGAELYGTVCSACHGAGGAGTPAAPALNDDQWINISGSFDEINSLIHSGVPNPKEYAGAMPPLGGGNFNEEQVRALSAYVFALSHQ